MCLSCTPSRWCLLPPPHSPVLFLLLQRLHTINESDGGGVNLSLEAGSSRHSRHGNGRPNSQAGRTEPCNMPKRIWINSERGQGKGEVEGSARIDYFGHVTSSWPKKQKQSTGICQKYTKLYVLGWC